MTPMRRLLPFLCASAAVLALQACAGVAGAGLAGAGVTQPVKQGSFQLLPRQSIDLAPGIALAYDSVSDSRCPPDVQCMWAGQLSYQFALKTPDSAEVFSLGPGRPEYTSPALHGMRIVLDIQAIPSPRTAQAVPVPQAVALRVLGQ
jgi:hypothetical protein